jgi:para-aminobenzoate synthetase component 1
MPQPTLKSLLHAARDLPGVACFDTGLGVSILTWGDGSAHTESAGWQDFVRAETKKTNSADGLYTGGVVGWLGYEAGASVERMPFPVAPRATHDVCLWRTNGSIEVNHLTHDCTVHGSEHFRAQAEALVLEATSQTKTSANQSAANPWLPKDHLVQSKRYTQGVQSVLNSVRAGDVYQVNLSWEQTDIPIADAQQTWLNLRELNPALRGCYLRFLHTEIVSNSPELFLYIDPTTRRVSSAPIKGTAPTNGGESAKLELLESPKEKAELTMIVDLVRNDLGRIAMPGSVTAAERTIRRCGDIWHAEQTVSATLNPNVDAVDTVSAAFPPGSVTGAPKVRAMEVIHSLENHPRGVYTGALGWFSDGGGAHLNVAIRTATILDGNARFHVGAGIVADSQPNREWNETLVKAQALAHSLGA